MYEDIFDKDAPSSLLFKGRERYVPTQIHLKGKHPIRSLLCYQIIFMSLFWYDKYLKKSLIISS